MGGAVVMLLVQSVPLLLYDASSRSKENPSLNFSAPSVTDPEDRGHDCTGRL